VRSYNQFTPKQRMRAYNWLKAEYAAGRRTRPMVCDACTQDLGVIEPHSEDYSGPPFGDHIGEHGVCYVCHMQIHCRFRAPAAWQAYRIAVRSGAIFKPFHGRAFGAFTRLFLGASLPEPARLRPVTGPTVLDAIEEARRPQ
jgi:hypothetical protein